jgi:large subunit ribosomal protein L23
MPTKAQATERMYNVLVRPIVTEKSTQVAEHNVTTFEVARNATKAEIRNAIETLYKVEVNKVNTLIRKGKNRGRAGGVVGRRSDMKLAYVSLKEGQSIDISAGL